MKVAVNLLWLVPGVVGGSEEHTVRQLLALADARPDDLDVVVFANRALAEVHPAVAASFPVVAAPSVPGGKAGRVALESTWLAAQVRRHGADLVHHAGGVVPFVAPGPTAVTIHDLQPVAMPGNFSPAKRWFARWTGPRSARVATRVLTLTRWVRDDVVHRTGIDAARTSIVPPVVEVGPEPPVARRREVRRTYDLADRPFLLYPAITYAHKNHVSLVHAFAAVHARHPDAVLVLTGGAGPREGEVAAAVARLGLAGSVRRTGRIPAADLDVLQWEASALTFPSRYEGCGLPVIEAMARGCPVVAADVGGLPEVVADGGWLVGPVDVDGWAHAMDVLLADDEVRRARSAAALARGSRFGAAAGAAAVVEAYRRAASAR